jgi:predicted nucleotidyltransferase
MGIFRVTRRFAMPVRSLSSPVLKWPDVHAVDTAVRRWAGAAAKSRPGVALVGYFGSYARGDWGVGSDLDMVIVVEESTQPFERRAIEWDLTSLPVPADVMVYTLAEWQSSRSQSKFFQMLQEETVWVYPP